MCIVIKYVSPIADIIFYIARVHSHFEAEPFFDLILVRVKYTDDMKMYVHKCYSLFALIICLCCPHATQPRQKSVDLLIHFIDQLTIFFEHVRIEEYHFIMFID